MKIANFLAINIAEKFVRCRIFSVLRRNSYTPEVMSRKKNIVKLELDVWRTAPWNSNAQSV
jgi:hypothetical protein